MTTINLYEALAIEDIRGAADVLETVFEASGGDDGYVSLEVSPHLAYDTEGTIAEAERLWRVVDRPNLMIKVPATPEGIEAIERLIARGINVNATLMFSLGHYEAVAGAYLRGLKACAEPARVASVASFFVSRVDTKIDAALEALATPAALDLRGKAAIANSKLAYRRFEELFGGEAFAIKAIPAVLGSVDLDALLADLSDDLIAGGPGRGVAEIETHMLATLACHTSVRANQRLSIFEMRALLESLDRVDFQVCAHGRPVFIRLGANELHKRFHRS